jgi:hypothetical protein
MWNRSIINLLEKPLHTNRRKAQSLAVIDVKDEKKVILLYPFS